MYSLPPYRILGLMSLLVVLLTIFSTGGVAAQSADLVVAQDGNGDYTSIQNAVDNASSGDRIEVQAGTYEESTYINKNITLTTSGSVKISNSSTVSDRAAIEISKSVKPVIDGFRISGWGLGVEADFSEGRWEVRNVTIKNTTRGINTFSSDSWVVANTTIESEEAGISLSGNIGDPIITNTHISNTKSGIIVRRTSAKPLITGTTITNVASGIAMFKTAGELRIRDTKIHNVESGIGAYKSVGNWTTENITISTASDDAISVGSATGDWQIQNADISDISGDGVYAANTEGDWQIRDTSIDNAEDAVDTEDATGDWQVENATLIDSNHDAFDAANTTGDWSIANTEFSGTSGDFIKAEYSEGAWEVQNTTVENAQNGIDTEDATGSWKVTDLTVYNVTRDGIDASRTTGDWNVTDSKFTSIGIAAIEADETEGSWRVTNSILTNGTGTAINAKNAMIEAYVGYNYWGAADGPSPLGSGGEAYGNLTISPGHYADAQLTNLIRPFAAPVIFAPSGDNYKPSRSYTIGANYNATGVISSSDVGIRLVNVTEQNNTVVAVNNSSTVPVDTGGNPVNTTVPAGELSGDVQIETQLYNTSAETVEATDRLNLTVAGPGDLTGDENAATDPDGDGLYEDVNGDGKTNFEDAVALAFINANDLTEVQKDAVDFDGDGDIDFDDAVELAFV